jgi:hypothetical protein
MITHPILSDRRRLLFLFSMCVTIGTWLAIVGDTWAVTPATLGILFVQLGNNVFANMIKNIGIMGSGVTDESDPTTQLPKDN